MSDTFDLSSATDQSSGDTVVVRNFENLDWTLSGASLTVTGSSAANNIIGSQSSDTIDGGAGLDVIDGQSGSDRITYRSTASAIGGGADVDTLVVLGAVTINLNNGDQTSGDTVTVTGFENVDALGSTAGVTATGRNDYLSTLIGGSGADTFTAGSNGARLIGHGGADTLVGGAGGDSFDINSSDFAAGESINGGGGTNDTLYVGGTSDFTVGSLSNVEYLYADAVDASGTPIESGMTVTLTGAQAAGFSFIQANQYFGTTAEAFIINVASGTTVDLSAINWGYFDLTDSVAINGAAGNETITFSYTIAATIHGNGGADTLKTEAAYGFWNEGTSVFGDGGNDRIDYGFGGYATVINGGAADTDTLVYSYSEAVRDQIDLSNPLDQSQGDAALVSNFENLDWSFSSSGLDAIGSSGANSIIGSQLNDTINGGEGSDTIEGGSDADTLTGGLAGDVFVWKDRYTSFDTITDFLAADDDLRFAASAFDFNGATFNQRLATGSTATDITGVDLLIYTGANLDFESDVQTYLGAAAGGSVGEGVFIVGKNSSNHTVLYHALDASFTVNSSVVQIADLGTLTGATSIQLADFLFV